MVYLRMDAFTPIALKNKPVMDPYRGFAYKLLSNSQIELN